MPLAVFPHGSGWIAVLNTDGLSCAITGESEEEATASFREYVHASHDALSRDRYHAAHIGCAEWYPPTTQTLFREDLDRTFIALDNYRAT